MAPAVGADAGSVRRSNRSEPSSATKLPQPEITIAFALVKGERPEWVVQKLTEVGVDRIVPFVAERSVVQWDDGEGDAEPRAPGDGGA